MTQPNLTVSAKKLYRINVFACTLSMCCMVPFHILAPAIVKNVTMLIYIKNLLPRLRQFSQSLDKIELLVEHPWVLIDDELNQHKYIFRRNGDLLMSINGKGIKGKWEYLTVAKSIWIDRVQDNIMLNHDFVDPAVMILKLDGNKDMPFVLANENLIPDMDVVKYLDRLIQHGGNYLGAHQRGEKYYPTVHKTSLGNVTVHQIDPNYISNGDSVFVGDNPAPDGRYKIGLLFSITVQNGKIIKC